MTHPRLLVAIGLAFRLAFGLAMLGLVGCAPSADPAPETPAEAPVGETLFTDLSPEQTGIDFANEVTQTRDFNIFSYRNFYNGGGVGLGDFDGDGRLDVFLTANNQPNRLYLNRGGFRFEDVTDAAGVAGRHAWSTGVSVADVDGDGRLDVYVGVAGATDDRRNELYLNLGINDEGVPTFREAAAEHDLDDPSYTIHAAFFDYDRDGDLDAYLLNNSPRPVSSFGLRNIRHVRHEGGGDKLLRNDDGRFVDVSEAAGIYGSEPAFGLGLIAGDLDGDGWPDLYISNDFHERDYLYLNNRDGTFREVLEDAMRTISLSSMGADMGDIDNDGRPELYVTDMLPEDDRRRKTTSIFESWPAYQEKLRFGYYHQFMRNTLHQNLGDGQFAEVGQMAGVAATDWSWSALFGDYDLDGFKDLFVTNGVFRDVIDQDYVTFLGDNETLQSWLRDGDGNVLGLIEAAPSNPIPNVAFHNEGDGTFVNRAAAWGLAKPGFSSGAAHGDLDGDGDLDLVINNTNAHASVYRNEADTLLGHRFLRVALEGTGRNRFGVGATVALRQGGQVYFQTLMPTRGYQSSVEPVLTFGLGTLAQVDTLVVTWPDGRTETRTDVATNQTLTLRQSDAVPSAGPPADPLPTAPPLFADVTATVGLDFVHEEDDFVDFDREPLLPWMTAREGPALATADVNGDGREDLFLGGAKGIPGRLFLQTPRGTFAPAAVPDFDADRASEDVDAAFFDADGDGRPDLYVVSGGSADNRMAPALQDRLYLGDGRGGFVRAEGVLPAVFENGATVAPADFDGDGDTDLFVGSRSQAMRYGPAPKHILLENDGAGRFSNVTSQRAPALRDLGLVTDATWADLDGDGREDLVVVGEWMAVTVLRNTGAALAPPSPRSGLADTHGLWSALAAADLDGDGDTDLVAGNLGLNTRLRATPAEPLTMLVNDFDGNGFVEQILTIYRDGTLYPLPLRNDLLAAVRLPEDRFPTHADYAARPLAEVFTPQESEGALELTATTLATTVFLNDGTGTFTRHDLPADAQRAPVFAILAEDLDGDGHTDLLLAGNREDVRPEFGRMAASRGTFLRGDGAGGFAAVPLRRSGLDVSGAVRGLARLGTGRRARLFFAKNNAPVQVFEGR